VAVTSSNPDFFPFLWPFSVAPYLLARSSIFLRFPVQVCISRAAAHGAVDLQCWSLHYTRIFTEVYQVVRMLFSYTYVHRNFISCRFEAT